MPMYEYRCQDCGERFEALRKVTDADTNVLCPACQGARVERLISGFAMSGGGGSSSAAGGGGCGPSGGGSRGRFR